MAFQQDYDGQTSQPWRQLPESTHKYTGIVEEHVQKMEEYDQIVLSPLSSGSRQRQRSALSSETMENGSWNNEIHLRSSDKKAFFNEQYDDSGIRTHALSD